MSGVCPQISVILGKCAGGAVYAPINTDVVVATEESYMFVTGPDVIKSVTGEEVSLEDLGGARKQAEYGNIHHVAPDEKAAFDWVREYLSFMPSSCTEKAPLINPGLEPEITESDLELNAFMPDADNAGYDMHDIILRIFDDGNLPRNRSPGRAQRDHRVLPRRRPARRCRGQPAHVPQWRPRCGQLRQGCPFHAPVRRFQHPARFCRRHTRLSSRRRSGKGRCHQAWRAFHVLVHRSHCPEGDCGGS